MTGQISTWVNLKKYINKLTKETIKKITTVVKIKTKLHNGKRGCMGVDVQESLHLKD